MNDRKYKVKKTKRLIKNLNKSGKIPCEICNEPHILQTHHIQGREIPNANHPSNLVNICANCHNAVHWGQIIIERWIMTSSGLELAWHKKGEESFTGEDSSPHIIGSS